MASNNVATALIKRAWTTPQIKSADIKELTRSGEGSGVDSGTMFGMAMISDARLKTEITACGQTDGGIPIYSFRYLGGGPLHVGVMAQDLLSLAPGSVTTDEIGVMRVDYARIGMEPAVIPI